MARRSRFSEVKGIEAVKLAGAGQSLGRIALGLCVSTRCLVYWLEAGRLGDPKYADFARDFDAARAEAHTRALESGVTAR
jgi:hypothetical protein